MSSTAVGTTPDPPHLSSRWSTCEQFAADGCPTMQQLGGLEQEGMLTAPGATFTKFLCPRQRKSQVILFPTPPSGRGSLAHRNPPVQRLQLHLPLQLPCPFPGPAAARPAHTNGAHELLKSFLQALFLRSCSQRPPVATCQSRGLITCAGLGAAHSSPASPCKMLTSGRWAPRPPAGSTEGTRGGRETWPTHSAGTDKKHRKMEKEVARSMSVQLCAASGHTACPTPGWTLTAAWNCGEIKIYVSALTCLGKWEWGGVAREEDGET